MINTHTENDNNKKKAVIILLGLLLAIAILLGSLFAFFSDIASGDEEITAGTLALDGGAKFFINGNTDPATKTELENINPGDTIKAVISIENIGSKSAWLKFSLALSGADGAGNTLTGAQISDAFNVYEGIVSGSGALKTDSNNSGITFFNDGQAVIDGTYEKETGTPPNGVTFIGDTSTDYTFTIEFKDTAGNFWQAAKLSIGYDASALQYRNNPAPNWLDAEENIYKAAYNIGQ